MHTCAAWPLKHKLHSVYALEQAVGFYEQAVQLDSNFRRRLERGFLVLTRFVYFRDSDPTERPSRCSQASLGHGAETPAKLARNSARAWHLPVLWCCAITSLRKPPLSAGRQNIAGQQ